MVRLISLYPDGVTGAALLLMRISSASVLIALLPLLDLTQWRWWLGAICAAVIGLALAAGFGTRAAAVLLVLALAAAMLAIPASLVVLLFGSAGAAGALVLLGPGAYSVDAHLFGRRVIRVEPPSPDRGSAG